MLGTSKSRSRRAEIRKNRPEAPWFDLAALRESGAGASLVIALAFAVIDPVQAVHRGGMGTEAVNGVVLAGLFDLVIGTVGWLTRPDTRSATVNLAMSFFRPTHGDRISAEARLVRGGMNLIFASAEIFDGEGKVSARCDGTCAISLGKADSQELYERMRGGGVAP